MKKNAQHFRRRGAIVVLTALLLITVVALAALAIDLGHIHGIDAELQNAADSAALAGVMRLTDGPDAAKDHAVAYATYNEVNGSPVVVDPDEDIQLGLWDEDNLTFTALSEPDEANADSVRVTCRRAAADGNPIDLFFARALGQTSADVNVYAIAQTRTTVRSQLTGINKVVIKDNVFTDSYDSDVGPYNVATAGSNGHVSSNGEITLTNSALINGDARPGPSGSVDISGSANVTGTTTSLSKALSLAAVDPSNAIATNNNANIPLSASGNVVVNGSVEFSLSGNDSLALPPGTYYFTNFTTSGSSTVNITGQTAIYCTGNISMVGSSTLNNTTQTPANLQIFSTGTSITFTGAAPFYGAVYAPTARIDCPGPNANSDYFGMMVGLELNLTGSAKMHFDEAVSVPSSSTPILILVE